MVSYILYENVERGFVSGTVYRNQRLEFTYSENVTDAMWWMEEDLKHFLKNNRVAGSVIVLSLTRECNATDFIRREFKY